MNRKAQVFINAYLEDIEDAIEAITEVDRVWGREKPMSAVSDQVAYVFSLIAIVYVEYCNVVTKGELAGLVIDTYFFFAEGAETSRQSLDLLENMEIFDELKDSFTAEYSPTLEILLDHIRPLLTICNMYDNSNKTSTRKRFLRALTRFAYLLMNTDLGTNPYKKRFYNAFKHDLAFEEHDDLDMASLIEDRENKNAPSLEPNSTVQDAIDIEDLLKEIESLIGLDNIKKEVQELINVLQVSQLRVRKGLPSLDASRHMVFYGNPGTGKTTIARKLALVYRALGLLSKGHMIETDRSGLVAGYLGQTAIKTKQVLEQAKGGLLFIDEAYSLSQGGEQDQYGQEAIETLLKYMEDNRDDLVVVIAGYESKISLFLDSNPGLKSRFAKYFHFPDYSSTELAAIFTEMATKSSYRITAGFEPILDQICQIMTERKSSSFGNARTMRNLFERCVSNQANRVVSLVDPSTADLSELSEVDISISDLDIVMR